ncbi:lysozyme inhibitor LprI family protein [Sphingomonas psychrotolerans]|uniref:Lysozyme inhibitor LprI N-terminal domain-containing protein n=1 Tax=Sphingomonas psychrotolerans TaxID=1327635 RepID=A0A2K8MC08_9SPHN|nr:lysozyme inhibitor LprI family protein [Sphingomonas psychrotolerans]ATY31425.1 hypothetical protein CVN68_05040 [Sphingomonas psychrotolerans]
MARIAGFGLFALLLALFGLPAATPQSASFDCSKASHPLEKTICASPKLSRLDGEVATLYRARLASLFDKASFRGQQRDWQQVLRTRCARTCDPAAVEADYTRQVAALRNFTEEAWEASYKTADVATLAITHVDANQFDFTLVRDREGEMLCKFPANDSEAGAIATLASPARARWSAGACKIDFLLTRDRTGHVTRIDTNASAGCKHYCKGNYGLSDAFLPANNWVAASQ